jgi:hypothetical protein
LQLNANFLVIVILVFSISEYFGWHVQDRLQDAIKSKHHGELLVGQVEIIPTDHDSIPYVISVPTMRVPMDIKGTVNPYLVIRGVLQNDFGVYVKYILQLFIVITMLNLIHRKRYV